MTLSKSLLIPLAVFILLVVVLAVGFRLEDPHLLPSELVDRPFPEFSLTALADGRTVSREDVVGPGEITLVNVWATWCPNCVIEHPELLRISREEGIRLVGVNYNDERDKALAWLQRYESPYAFNVFDNDGKLAIELGVYGAPETFVVDTAGVIRMRYVGPVTPNVWRTRIKPVIDRVRGGDA